MVGFTGTRNGVECPDEFSGVNVPGADVTTGAVRRIFLYLCSGEDEIFVDRGWGRRSVVSFREFVGNAFSEVYYALVAEARIQLASFGIERVQSAIHRGDYDLRRE